MSTKPGQTGQTAQSMSSQDLAAKAAQAQTQKDPEGVNTNTPSTQNQTQTQAPEPEAESDNRRKFKFQIAPCTYKFKCHGERVICPDGTYTTTNPKEIAELESKVKQRLLREIKPGQKLEPDMFDEAPEPLGKLAQEQS